MDIWGLGCIVVDFGGGGVPNGPRRPSPIKGDMDRPKRSAKRKMAPPRRNWRRISRRGAAETGGKLAQDLAEDIVANRGRRCREKRIEPVKDAPATDGRYAKSNRR